MLAICQFCNGRRWFTNDDDDSDGKPSPCPRCKALGWATFDIQREPSNFREIVNPPQESNWHQSTYTGGE